MKKKLTTKAKFKLNIDLKKILITLKKMWINIFVLAICVSVLIYVVFDKSSKEFNDIIVANNKLISGQKIKESDISYLSIPKSVNLNGMIDYKDKNKLVGLVIANDLEKNDLILSHTLFKTSDEIDRNIVDSSKKLFFITSSDVEVIPYNVKPNDRISVYGVDTKTNKNELVLNTTKVLLIDKKAIDDGKALNYIALELNDNEIQSITNALSNKWYLQMVLVP